MNNYDYNYVTFNKDIIIESVGLTSILLLCGMITYGIISESDFNIQFKKYITNFTEKEIDVFKKIINKYQEKKEQKKEDKTTVTNKQIISKLEKIKNKNNIYTFIIEFYNIFKNILDYNIKLDYNDKFFIINKLLNKIKKKDITNFNKDKIDINTSTKNKDLEEFKKKYTELFPNKDYKEFIKEFEVNVIDVIYKHIEHINYDNLFKFDIELLQNYDDDDLNIKNKKNYILNKKLIIQYQHEIYMNINFINKTYGSYIQKYENLLNDTIIINNKINDLIEIYNEKEFYNSDFFNNFTNNCNQYTYLQSNCIIEDYLKKNIIKEDNLNLYEYILSLFIYNLFENIYKYIYENPSMVYENDPNKKYNISDKINEIFKILLSYYNKLKTNKQLDTIFKIESQIKDEMSDNSKIIGKFYNKQNNFMELLEDMYITKNKSFKQYTEELLFIKNNGGKYGKNKTKRRKNKLNNRTKKNLNISH